jgi:hypothetical protein
MQHPTRNTEHAMRQRKGPIHLVALLARDAYLLCSSLSIDRFLRHSLHVACWMLHVGCLALGTLNRENRKPLRSQLPLERLVEDRGQQGVELGGGFGLEALGEHIQASGICFTQHVASSGADAHRAESYLPGVGGQRENRLGETGIKS